MEHGLLQEKLIEVSAEEVVLNFLTSRKQSKYDSESGLYGKKIYPKKWKLTDKEWQYLEGDEEAKCCKLTFTWKRYTNFSSSFFICLIIEIVLLSLGEILLK